MTNNMRISCAGLALSSVLGLAGCDPPTGAMRSPFSLVQAEAPGLVGQVIGFAHGGTLVERQPADSLGVNRYIVSIPAAPLVTYYRDGAAATPSAITVGRRVSVWLSADALYSNPPIVGARLLVIEP